MEGKQNPEKMGSDSDSEKESSSNISEMFPGTSSGFELMEDELLDSAVDDYDILIIEHPIEGSSEYHGDIASSSDAQQQPSSPYETLPQRTTSRSPSKRARQSHLPTSDESDDPRGGEDPAFTMDDHHSAHRDAGMECNHHNNGKQQQQQQRKKSLPRPRKTTAIPRADVEHPTRRSKKRGASESSDADVEDNTTPFVPLPTIQEEPLRPSTSQQKSKKSRSKCLVCKKKLGLTAIECRCGGVFCARHRYDSEHDCSFDYRAMGAEEIRRNNPVVIAEKVPKL